MLKINNNRKLFFQWDVGQSLAVELAEGEELTEVHIGNEGCNKFYVVEPIDNLVAVYDELLQSGNKVIAYEYIKSGEEGHTIRKNVFTVVDRPKATDYAYTPTESYSWEYWAERARLYAESAADEVASIPTKMAEWWAIHKPEIMEEIKTAIPPYDDSEIRAEIDGIQQELNDKMEFYKVEAQGAYTNISFYHDGTRLYYNDLVEKYNDPRYFLYAEFEGLTFIPSLPPVDYDPILEFICTWIYGGKPHVARLVINSDNAGKYDGYDVVITGNLNEYTKKTYVDAQLQLRASASELNDVKENLSELDSNVESLETNKVSKTDFATATTHGIVRGSAVYGFDANNGSPATYTFSYDSYLQKPQYAFIGKGTMENVLEARGYLTTEDTETVEDISNGKFVLIEDITLAQASGRFDKTTELDGAPYKFTGVLVKISVPPQPVANSNAQIRAYAKTNSGWGNAFAVGTGCFRTNVTSYHWGMYKRINGMYIGVHMASSTSTGSSGNLQSMYGLVDYYPNDFIEALRFEPVNAAEIPTGTNIKIYGVRG